MDSKLSNLKNNTKFLLLLSGAILMILLFVVFATFGSPSTGDDSNVPNQNAEVKVYNFIGNGHLEDAGFSGKSIKNIENYLKKYFNDNYPDVTRVIVDSVKLSNPKKTSDYYNYIAKIRALNIYDEELGNFELTIHAYSYDKLDFGITAATTKTE